MHCSGRTKPTSVFGSFDRQSGYGVSHSDCINEYFERNAPSRHERKQASKAKSKKLMSNMGSRSAQMGGSSNQTKDSPLLASSPLFTDLSIQSPSPHMQHYPSLAASRHQTSKQKSLITGTTTITQRQTPNSLPFSAYPATSHGQKIYNPTPVTEVYQLDRFLDEIPDFRSISLSGDQARNRNERHRKALKTRLSVLERLL
jgi:hypothetical protein